MDVDIDDFAEREKVSSLDRDIFHSSTAAFVLQIFNFHCEENFSLVTLENCYFAFFYVNFSLRLTYQKKETLISIGNLFNFYFVT